MANSKDGLDLSTASTPAPPWQYGPSSYEGTLGQSTRYAPPTYATGNSMEAMGASVQATPYPVSPTPLSQPPPPAFTEQPLGPGLTTVTPGAAPQSAVVIHTAGFSVVPVIGTCAKCGSRVTTRVSYESGTLTWIACSVTCVFCPLFCWLIPFCIREFKDVYHYCPECYHLMGVHQRMK